MLSMYGATHEQQQWLAQQQQLRELEQQLAPAEQLSVAALDQMRQHKVALCVAALADAGFRGPAALEAAGGWAVGVWCGAMLALVLQAVAPGMPAEPSIPGPQRRANLT